MKITLNDGVSTAIYELKADAQAENANVYNLLGQKVNPRSGEIYITNGKKFVR
jgi:hypothetical protein